jgi:hypothetical protein
LNLVKVVRSAAGDFYRYFAAANSAVEWRCQVLSASAMSTEAKFSVFSRIFTDLRFKEQA